MQVTIQETISATGTVDQATIDINVKRSRCNNYNGTPATVMQQNVSGTPDAYVITQNIVYTVDMSDADFKAYSEKTASLQVATSTTDTKKGK